MASRYHALQNLMAAQQKERTELAASLDGVQAAIDSATTPEEKAAQNTRARELTARAAALSAEIEATETEFAAVKRLQDAERAAPGAVTREPAQVTPRAEQDPKRGFKSIGEFAQLVAAADPRRGGKIDERLLVAYNDSGTGKFTAAAPTPLHQETSSSDGYMVPPDFRAGILQPAFENDDLLAMVNPQTTSSNAVTFVRDETTPWGAAGIIAYWVAEGTQITGSKLGTKGGEIKLHKVAAMVFVTDELLQDAALITSRINEKAPIAIAWTVSEAIMRGTGAGQPLGWENSGAKVSVAKESSQAAATINANNIFKMHSRLLAGPGSRVGWLANRDTVPQLGIMSIGNEPSWTGQNKGMTEAPSGLLLGDPIRFSEHCQTLGTTGDIQLINFAGYLAFIHSGGTRFDSSIHLYFDYDITAFRWTLRVGGQPLLSAPVSPFKGSATKSHFVYLDTRA